MTEQTGVNHIENADRNQKVVMNIVRERSPITRKEVASISGLSVSTTKRIVESLTSSRILIETDADRPDGSPARRGRKAQALSINPSYAYSIGVSVRPGAFDICAVDLEGTIVAESREDFETTHRDSVIGRAVGGIRYVAEAAKTEDRGLLLGVGVGVAGVVDARSGLVHYCPGLPGWESTPLEQMLEHTLGCDVLVDDGVRCLALAEKRYGRGKPHPTFAYLYFGRGVGAGLLLDNVLYRGRNGLSGEFGHTTVAAEGPLCRCGNRGCLEAMVSEEAIVRTAREMIESRVYTALRHSSEEPLHLDRIGAMSRTGDKVTGMIVHDVGESIGTAVTNLVNLLDPGVVICSGEVVDSFGDSLIEGVRRIVKLRGIHSIAQRTTIERSSFSGFAPRGAATMLIERFFDTDILGL